jgi:hypothetical protein
MTLATALGSRFSKEISCRLKIFNLSRQFVAGAETHPQNPANYLFVTTVESTT